MAIDYPDSDPRNRWRWPEHHDQATRIQTSNDHRKRRSLITCYRLGAAVRLELGDDQRLVLNLTVAEGRQLAAALTAAAENLEQAEQAWWPAGLAAAEEEK